ncbi:MAG: hypothetical protein ACRDQZ_25170 [Mycobacteriales bacterium]
MKEDVNERIRLVLRMVYKEQGCIIVGQPAMTPARTETARLKLGDVITRVFGQDMRAQFAVTSIALRGEWTSQCELITRYLPDWSLVPTPEAAVFFRIVLHDKSRMVVRRKNQ